MPLNRYIVSIPIIRRRYKETSSAKFKGILNFVSNEHGIIYDWQINFSEVFVDLYTTKSWFTKKTSQFIRRENLFKELGLVQEKRPKGGNKIIKLSKFQLGILNNFFNDRNKYNSTIKNIIGILKGNNPGGEAKKPQSAELIINDTSPVNNFVILFDDLTMKQKIEYNAIVIGATSIDFHDFVNLNTSLSSAFNFMQKSKTLSTWSTYLTAIKDYYEKYNIDIAKAQSIANKARAQYSKAIDDSISNFPFGFVDKNQFTKCHIYEFHDLRDEIVRAIRNSKSYSKFFNMIRDPNNFIPLPNEVHRKFDANYFTYKEDGSIHPISEIGRKYVEDFVDEKFKAIPNWFMTEKRIDYFRKRNQKIISRYS